MSFFFVRFFSPKKFIEQLLHPRDDKWSHKRNAILLALLLIKVGCQKLVWSPYVVWLWHNITRSLILCGLLLRSVTSQQPVSYALCTVFRDPLVLGAIELVVSFLCSLLVYGHDKLQFGTFGFREPKILIHVAFLFNRSFLCIEAVEDDALPIRRRNILSNSKQPGISWANILCFSSSQLLRWNQ